MITVVCLFLTLFGCDSPPTPTPKPKQPTPAPSDLSDHPPAIALVSSPDTLTLPDDNHPGTFYLSATPSGQLHWKVTAKPDWLTVQPTEGDIDRDIVEVNVRFSNPQGAAGAGGFRSGDVQVISNGGVARITVKGNMTIANAGSTSTVLPQNSPTAKPIDTPTAQPPPIGAASVSQVEFTGGTTTASFVLSNTGSTAFDWVIAASDAWIGVQPRSGSLAPNAQSQVTVTKDLKQIPSGYADGFITISSTPAGVEIQLPVLASATDMWVLDQRVIDAEYNAETDVIVTISADPSQLNIVHPSTGKVDHVALPVPPQCVSIQPDGAFAAVGHNAHISYVDLKKKTVERTYDTSSNVEDVVLAGNGRIYAFPANSEIDLKTGGEQSVDGRVFRTSSVVRLHPSGQSLYSADRGTSPADISKFDISSGRLVGLGDSPYHGDYEMGGNLWLSEDGAKIFVAAGNVFRSSTVKSQDMIYAGQLEGVSGLRWVDTSSKAKRVFALDGGWYYKPQAPGLRVYESDYLAFKGTVDLPPFRKPTNPTKVESQGYYVFVNDKAGQLYVLLNADPSAGIDKDWALTTFDLSKMP